MLGIWPSNLLFPLKPQDYFLRIKYDFAVCCMAYLTNPLLLSNESFPVFAVINGSEINVYYYTLITIFLDKVLHVEFLDPKINILKLWLCLDPLVSRRPLLSCTSVSRGGDTCLFTPLLGLGGIIFPGFLSFLGCTVGRKARLILHPQVCSSLGMGELW